MTTCVYQVSQSVLLSRRGNHPRTDSRNRSRHSLANRRRNHGKRGNRGNRDSRRNRAKRPVRRSWRPQCFPYRIRRRSLG